MAATRLPIDLRIEVIARDVWLLPQPVRTAQTAMTGLVDSSIVLRCPMMRKSAPAVLTMAALCMTFSYDRSEYAIATWSTSCFWISSVSFSSGSIGMPLGYLSPQSSGG